MPRVFISYARASKALVEGLVTDLGHGGHTVWYDRELKGGQAWWDQILAQIREAEVFVFALGQHSQGSEACMREWRYATDLGVPVLPLQLGPDLHMNLLPAALSRMQFVPYGDDKASALRVTAALNAMPVRGPLPDPLPPPPEVPISYIVGLAERVSAKGPMDSDEQNALLLDLKRALRDAENASDARRLLERLRERSDLLKVVDEDIAEALGTAPPPSAEAPPPDPGPTPGSDTPEVAPTPPEAEATTPPAPERRKYGLAGRMLVAAVFMAVGLAAAAFAIDQWRMANDNRPDLDYYLWTLGWAYPPLIFYGLAGLIAGGNARRIAWAGGGALLGLLFAYVNDPDPDATTWRVAIGAFAPLGAFIGATIGAIWVYLSNRRSPPAPQTGAAKDAQPL